MELTASSFGSLRPNLQMQMDIKSQSNHYLHPDFEEINVHVKNKPSPLALLAQTCQNIGSVNNNTDLLCFNKSSSPNFTLNGLRKRRDSSSNNSSIEHGHLSPTKKLRSDFHRGKRHCDDNIEMKPADTSTDRDSIANITQFLKCYTTTDTNDPQQMTLLRFLANKCCGTNENKVPVKSVSGNLFNVSGGYHLESNEISPSQPVISDQQNYRSPTHPGTAVPTTSAIKFCMYCGQFIPVLPVLLAHIRHEHSSTTSSEPPNMYDFVSQLNPCFTTNQVKSHQRFSFLTDYINSSLHGIHNLIC